MFKKDEAKLCSISHMCDVITNGYIPYRMHLNSSGRQMHNLEAIEQQL